MPVCRIYDPQLVFLIGSTKNQLGFLNGCLPAGKSCEYLHQAKSPSLVFYKVMHVRHVEGGRAICII